MKRLINVMLLCVAMCSFFSCSEGYEDDNNVSINNNNPTEEGLYVGIVGFNDKVYEKNIGVLNSNTKYSYTSFIENLSSSNGTALYYSVNAGINNLCQATLPAELENVSIVTFTDGLDNFSTIMPDIEKHNYTKKEYLSIVNQKLTTTKVKAKEITAYSIGIIGDDVQDEDEFKNNLSSLSTSDTNIYQVDNMDDVNNAFEDIAKSLNTKSVSKSITLKISGGIDDGSQIRFTLDNVTSATNSRLYIEGNIYRSNRTLKNISCKGIEIDNDNIDINIISGFIVITFNNVKFDNEIVVENIKYWTMNSRDEWQKDSEFNPASQASTTIIRKSAAIMLVLDCSSSLGEDFERLKSTAKDFIELLVSGESYYKDNETESYNGVPVELGLSVKWASCNVGASSPEDYGDYYAWGETSEKTYYSEENYLYYDSYIGNDISGTKYDVAHIKCGGDWRMPTKGELKELLEECDWTWTTLNGVNGCKVTGPNGNSIFLPAAGGRSEADIIDRGLAGYYWSSSFDDDNNDAVGMMFYDEDYVYVYGSPAGISVRPVSE